MMVGGNIAGVGGGYHMMTSLEKCLVLPSHYSHKQTVLMAHHFVLSIFEESRFIYYGEEEA